jgi:lysylphosphatidylglycerol synthetase-like protein (DUF2156 family)
MRWVRSFAEFIYDFVVGDDWRLALGVVVGLALTAGLSHRGSSAWWVLPVVVAAGFALSLRRAVLKSAPCLDR